MNIAYTMSMSKPPKGENEMKKIFKILPLMVVVIAASFYMINESANFYNEFYGDMTKALYLAALLEGFLLILASIKVGKFAIRMLCKIVMFGIFAIIISAAGLQAIKPTLSLINNNDHTVSIVDNHKFQIETLNSQVASLDNEFNQFISVGYKKNASIVSANKRIVLKQLDEVMGQMNNTKMNEKVSEVNNMVYAWAKIGIMFAIRLFIQFANTLCACIIGILLRSKTEIVKSVKKIVVPSLVLPSTEEIINKYTTKKTKRIALNKDRVAALFV